MKATETKSVATPAKKNSPFFSKESEQHFFGSTEKQPSYFFKPKNNSSHIQTKLTIGQPGDIYEKEADAMADKVVQRLATPDILTKKEPAIQSKPLAAQITPFVQTKCASCEQEEKLQKKEEVEEKDLLKDKLQKKPIFESNVEPPEDEKNIQRKCAECEKEEKLQKKENSSSQAAFPNIESSLSSSKGSGNSLPAATREQMENSFGADFSNVRLHTDSSAVQMNNDLQAQAFTHGNDIYFNSEKYDTNSNSGKHLLAHELTHVVQQGMVLTSEYDESKIASEKNDLLTIQRDLDTDPNLPKDKLPTPVQVNSGGDSFEVSFDLTGQGFDRRFYFVIRYLGGFPFNGPFNSGSNVSRLGISIRQEILNAKVLPQSEDLIAVDLYGYGDSIVKLIDKINFNPSPAMWKEHYFRVKEMGEIRTTGNIWVQDPNAKPEIKPEKLSIQDDIPGEKPVSHVIDSVTEIRIDGDGDQSKELLLRLKEKNTAQGSSNQAKEVSLEIMQISSKERRFVNFTIPEQQFGVNHFPIIREVTDGKAPTKISLILPIEQLFLMVHPPARNENGVTYLVEVGDQRFSFGFPPEQTPLKKIVSADKPQFIGGISYVDFSLGAYNDRFRITIQTSATTLTPTSLQKAIFGISALYRGKAVGGGMSAELQVVRTPNIKVLESDGISLKLDIDGDESHRLNFYDQLTTPADYDGGGPTEKNRNHHIRMNGPGIGEKEFYFTVRNGYLSGGYANPKASDRQAESNAMAVSGLTEQLGIGSTFEKEIDAYEAAFIAIRKKAADEKLITAQTFEAWKALSAAMIKLRPQINEQKKDPTRAIDFNLRTSAGSNAILLYDSLAQETVNTFAVDYSQGPSVAANPYTGETQTSHEADTIIDLGPGGGMPYAIISGQWDNAYHMYQNLVAGLDRWIVNRLKNKAGASKEEIQRAELLSKRRAALGEIEKYKPIRISAVFHPDKKFENDGGYISEIPLALYAYKDGDTWYLKNLTNPDKTYHKTVKASAGETMPPLHLFSELSDPDRFPEGVIHFEIPGMYGGQVRTKDYLTWRKFLTYLGLGLAAVGFTLVTFGTGAVAVAGTWAFAASALVGATAATLDLIVHAQEGDLDATTVTLNISQIVAGLAGASALAAGRIIKVAANAPAGARWSGAWARIALAADRLYVPLIATAAGADLVSFGVVSVQTAKQLDEIENGSGSPEDKSRAKAQLLSQLAVLGGLTALSFKGTISDFTAGRTLILHPGPEGIPVVTKALSKQSVVIDSNTAIALDRRAKGLELNEAHKDAIKRIEAMGDVELRVADPTIGEVGFKGGPVTQQGIPVIDRKAKVYQDVLTDLKNPGDPVGGQKLPKAENDQQIVADTFLAVTEPGVIPRFVTADPGIYNPLARRAGYDPNAKGAGIAVPAKFPNGFVVTINGRTIHVIPLPKVK